MSIYRLGDLELNEESRGLTLAGADIPVQPLVFDFLAHLWRHSDRAVSKQELLDVLWPDVTVTEASVQRVASLARGILRLAGVEESFRSLPRFGYRLKADAPHKASAPAAAGAGRPRSALEIAQAAVAGKRWSEAVAAFADADRNQSLRPPNLEHWALAIECTGRAGDAIEPLTRAVLAYCAAGNARDAADPALVLAKIHLEKGEIAVAKGWHKRACELIGEQREGREYGLWCYMGARIASAESEVERALALAEEAYAIGKALKDPEVESLGLIYRGFYRLCLGETDVGIEDQDFAAALGLSSDIDPVVGGILYCNILWACRNFGDWARANQWTLGYERWCRSCGLTDLSGSCRLHRAEVLGVQGTLREAEELVTAALDQLAGDAPWARGDALRVLGDIHLAAGDLAKAEKTYGDAYAVGWDPQPGYAMLLLEQGEAEAAYRGLERSLESRGWPTLQRRGLLLASLAKVAARTGRTERAHQIIDELETRPGRWPMASIKALTAEAKAELLIRANRQDDAIRELRAASALWHDVAAAINAAEACLSVAALLIDSGDFRGADFELRAAQQVAERVGSRRLLDRAEKLSARIAAEADSGRQPIKSAGA